MSGFRYCPNCGTQNDAQADRCVRCELVFAEYRRPSPAAAPVEHRERSQGLVRWMLGGLLLLVLAFAGYFLSVQPLVSGEDTDGKSTICELADRAETVFQRLKSDPGEEERERLRGEIGDMLTTLTLVPEGQDMEANLLLQRTLYELNGYAEKAETMDARAVRGLEERFVLIGRMVRPFSPPTP